MNNYRQLLKLFSAILVLTIGLAFSTPLLFAKQKKNEVIYNGLQPDEFMKQWWVLEPVPVFPAGADTTDEKIPRQTFNAPPPNAATLAKSLHIGQLEIDGKTYQWKMLQSDEDVVDLDNFLGERTWVYAYAFAEVSVPETTRVLLGVGSDDAVRMWLNGNLVHDNWSLRPVRKDEDLVEIKLQKGKNTFLLKIYNQEYDWGFACRALGEAGLPKILMEQTASGNLDAVKTILAQGIDVNVTTEPGVTALHLAQIKGRQEIVDLLLARGANPNIQMPGTEKLIDFLFTRAVKADYPGAAVLVAQEGKIVYQKGFGLAQIDKNIPITPETTFRIGSVTKQFTASAILKLVEEGRLALDDKLSKFIPDFPRGDEVTIHHLLTHTSGIHSYTNVPDFMEKVTEPIEPDTLVNKIKTFDYDFNPGDQWIYNNSGYFLLGYIIEKVSGKSYEAFLKQAFFESLGMENTGVYRRDLNLPHEALGYSYESDEVKPAVDWDMSHAGGAGNLYSNVLDLYRWNEAVFNGKVLSQASLEAASQPVKLNNKEIATGMSSHGYGYGWALGNMRGLKEIKHGGGLNGFNSYLCRLPEKNFTVVVLSNCLGNIPNLSPGAIANQIAELYFWPELEKQVSYATQENIDSTLLDDYVGRYDYGPSGIMKVVREGDRLFAQLATQPRFEIFPRTANEFFWKVVEARIVFERDDAGKVTHAIHHQGGAEFKVTKIAAEAEAQVDPSIYDQYVGEYELMPNAIFTVTREKDRLWVQLANQPRLEVFPRSEKEFFYKQVNASIEFVRDESGTVTSLILHQAGMHKTAPKIK